MSATIGTPLLPWEDPDQYAKHSPIFFAQSFHTPTLVLGGDSASNYFLRTECVAGVQDMRFQELMPDVLHWLGIRRVHRLVSMSNMKYDAITSSGIEVGERVKLPDDLIPADARVEMDAKVAAGYYTDGEIPDAEQLATAKGRNL